MRASSACTNLLNTVGSRFTRFIFFPCDVVPRRSSGMFRQFHVRFASSASVRRLRRASPPRRLRVSTVGRTRASSFGFLVWLSRTWLVSPVFCSVSCSVGPFLSHAPWVVRRPPVRRATGWLRRPPHHVLRQHIVRRRRPVRRSSRP